MPYTPTSSRIGKTYRRPKTGKNQEFYQKNRWKEVSRLYKMQHPVCEVSAETGLVAPAEVTDHIVPISMGGAEWDERNYMPITKKYHDRKRNLEASGYCVKTIDTPEGRIPADRGEIIRKLLKPAKPKINKDGSRG